MSLVLIFAYKLFKENSGAFPFTTRRGRQVAVYVHYLFPSL